MAIITGQIVTQSGTAGQTAYDTSGRAERRLFDFGDEVAELTPSETPFLTLMSKMAKKKVTDSDFKHFERRAPWKDNVIRVNNAGAAYTWSGTAIGSTKADIVVDDGASANIIGRVQKGDLVRVVPNSAGSLDRSTGSWAKTATAIVTNVDTTNQDINLQLLTAVSTTADGLANNDYLYLVGNASDEGGAKVSGYTDELDIRYGACEIFKTGYAMSNTLINTEFHGPHEWDRIRTDKMREHKIDIERALIFGRMQRQSAAVGSSWSHLSGVTDTGSNPNRVTDGIYSFVKAFGVSNQVITRTYANMTWANFIDDMEWLFDQSPDPRLVLMGLSVASFFGKVGDNTFLGAISGSKFGLDISISAPFTKFGVKLQQIQTPHGDLYLLRDPVLRGKWADLMLVLDMNNLEYCYLQNRDTYVSDVTAPGDDGKQENILTEAGLRIKLLETHVVYEFGTS